MEVIFLKSFLKDLKKVKNKKLKQQVKDAILEVEKAKTVSEISNIKKLSGFLGVYRIRIGSYRIGLYVNDSRVEFARFVKRADIYKLFP
ncbi:plasmid stabilization protein [Nonlabens arenilitoris]|uniref:Plasmid stabilization protein n=1 Tax=Nonlabens arenilitoris TaxID=1217969 RepID=A0A2S7UAX3_9FLAO|nr:type II toxin-antitoxin system RelE/ParE family toxin [Nonlabens arenilitoris]PQJ31751.1 plasmid stabilization protein [Nonlabens arenilitoris]